MKLRTKNKEDLAAWAAILGFNVIFSLIDGGILHYQTVVEPEARVGLANFTMLNMVSCTIFAMLTVVIEINFADRKAAGLRAHYLAGRPATDENDPTLRRAARRDALLQGAVFVLILWGKVMLFDGLFGECEVCGTFLGADVSGIALGPLAYVALYLLNTALLIRLSSALEALFFAARVGKPAEASPNRADG